MAAEAGPVFFTGVDTHPAINNPEHRTSEISQEQLIVRRGKPFTVSVAVVPPFIGDQHPLILTIVTGQYPTEELGTLSRCSIPQGVPRSPSAKRVWKTELKDSDPEKGILTMEMTPPADAPIGRYYLCGEYRDEEVVLATLVVLFNPWCSDDSVYMANDEKRQEYVMNEDGAVYRGTPQYISDLPWSFAQFEDDMVEICLKMLDMSHKHFADPARDVSARCDPVYVSRVVSAMINSEGDHGVLEGNWGGDYEDGTCPTHWSGSHDILKTWYTTEFKPVKYGQCWVFAAVMCSVMRLLGIPCRVVTNFASAHDCNGNMTIDVYHAGFGMQDKPSLDSIWNFHVWVEGWMKRPDLGADRKCNGWQVVDPTPQELSDGVFCCGPAPVKAILNGYTDVLYDVPFVFAEVNADVIDWLVIGEDSMRSIISDTKRVGHKISTKSVGCNKRRDVTRAYKHEEGTQEERDIFAYATRDYSKDDENEETDREESEDEEEEMREGNVGTEGGNETPAATPNVTPAETRSETPAATPNETPAETPVVSQNEAPKEAPAEAPKETPKPISPKPKVTMRFKEVTQPINGQDVSVKLVLHSKSCDARPLSITISVQGLKHNGRPAGNIQTEEKEATLLPDKDLSIRILVPFSAYRKSMLESESMKISAVVKVRDHPDETYLREGDILLLDPPVSVTVCGETTQHCKAVAEVIFVNPLDETLKNCTMTFCGCGLLKDEYEIKLQDLEPNKRFRINFYFYPYKCGQKTLVADFDCSAFRDIKGKCSVSVTALDSMSQQCSV